ncbi:hypothetical protein AGMMS49960_11290 [Betaproteobacteria bacterium]|nr:hypothetical protein AGMMS49543_24780 [Betaproteobacteria bacterium]GHU01320.1 hypothetical protein AGMMS49960_11290 [Betaproteobacteria bacterium]GHU17298.1 hypothetical protein AGMMS50243_05260 [Betaproteobacteria bacterium]
MRAGKYFSAFILWLFLVGNNALAGDGDRHFVSNIFNAGSVAYEDFEKHIQDIYVRDGLVGHDSIFIVFSKMENYVITLEDKDGYYWVQFTLRELKDSHFRGGGAKYKIGKNNLNVIERVLFK